LLKADYYEKFEKSGVEAPVSGEEKEKLAVIIRR